MECVVKWVGGMTFMAETGSGHVVTMDGATEARRVATWPPPADGDDAGRGQAAALPSTWF